MSEVKNVGMKLLTIPELTDDDVALLERLQHKIEEGRAAFVSYSRTDAERDWVKREVEWAVREYDAHGHVHAIIPVVLPDGDPLSFPELTRFERWDYPTSPESEKAAFDRLARGIVRTRRA